MFSRFARHSRAADRLKELEPQRLIYRLAKPGPVGRAQLQALSA